MLSKVSHKLTLPFLYVLPKLAPQQPRKQTGRHRNGRTARRNLGIKPEVAESQLPWMSDVGLKVGQIVLKWTNM